jgi:PTS system nitrogen regulatory IIA component
MPGEIELADLLTVDRIDTGCQLSSKKRLMEKITSLLLQGRVQLDRKTVLQTLIERERLGSTGIGNGVALPHGRINGLDDVIGAVVVLANPLDYDAVDNESVRLAFGLLVPAQANEQHLRILAHLARLFDDEMIRNKVFSANDNQEVFDILTTWTG